MMWAKVSMTGPAIWLSKRGPEGLLKRGDVDIDVDVEVDLDSYSGCVQVG